MATPVVAPLTGSVTRGTWVLNQPFARAGSPSGLGYMQYNYLLPAQYDPTLLYPILFVGHPIGSGMNGGVYPRDGSSFVTNASYGASFSLDTMFNTVAFRTAHPCVVVACQCDQTGNSGGTNANGVPGYNDSQNSSWNELAEVGIAQAFIAGNIVSGLQADPLARYHIGYSLGGIDTLAQMVDNNQYNGPGFQIWTAGITYSDQLFRPATANSAVFGRMATVPLATFSFTGDNVPGSYDQPAYSSYANGSTNWPTRSTYDSGGMAACRAGTSQYYYINNGSANSATTFMPMNADGGDGTAAYAWLFNQRFVGTPTPTPTPTPGTRNWYESPGMDGSFWVKPFQNSTNWITSGALITALRGFTPSVNTTGNFSTPWYIGRSTDPLVTVALANGSKSIQVHIPQGAIAEGPASLVDQSIGGADATKPYLVWSISGASINTTSVQASGSVITGSYGLQIDDGSGLMMCDIVTGQPGTNNSFGNIQAYELSLAAADPNYVIQHMLAFQLDVSKQASSAGPIFPLKVTDTSSGGAANPYAGPIPQGTTIGIPASTPRPTGKSRGFYLLWDQAQQFGLFNYNFGQVGGVNITVCDSSGLYTSLVNDIVASWPTVAQSLCIVNYAVGVSGAQYSLSTVKGAIPGSTNAFSEPPPLDLSPTNNLNVAPSTFGAWYPSGYNATPTNSTTTSPSLTIVTPTQQNATSPFGISGSIIAYTNAPTLFYRVDNGSWGPLPTGSVVSSTTFAFTVPGQAVGSHSVSVEDSNNTSVVVSSGSFQVVSVTTPVITVAAPSFPVAGIGFTLSGVMTNEPSTPALTSSDNSSAPVALPTGATVTASTFTFLHPALAAGNYTTVISDGTNSGSASFSATAIVGGASANGSFITTSTASLNDGGGNRWSISAGGQVVLNGVVDTTTANVIEMAWVSGNIWQKNASNLWWFKTLPTDSWQPPAGTTTDPLASLPTITINAIASPSPNTPFIVTGSLTNEQVIPTLTYSDNAGAAVAFPAGSSVSTVSFSFTHPGMPSGADTLKVSDGTVSNSISYTVVTPGFNSLPPTSNLTNTITGLAANTTYNVQVYATNSVGQGPPTAILTFTTSAAVVVAPGVPTGLTSTAVTSTSVTLFWSAPTSGTPPFTYLSRSSVSGFNTWTNGPTVSSTNAQITGLASGTRYDFEVAAINSAGTSAFSAIFTVSTGIAPVAVTWNPPTINGAMTLSNTNLTATTGGSTTAYAAHSLVLSSTSLSAGNASFEVTLTAITQNTAVGLANASFNSALQLAGDANSIGYYPSTGTGSQAAQTCYFNNAPILTPSGNLPAADVAGAVLTFCVNFDLALFWVTGDAMRVAYGAGAWNDSASASPVTGVGGLPLSVSGALSIAFNSQEGGAVGVLNAGSSPFVRAASIPSTFPAWNGQAVTTIVPGAVTVLTAGTPSNVSVALSWTAPTTGTLPFTYHVMQSPHGAGTYAEVATAATPSTTITGLTASTGYDFLVFAGNGAGSGGNSNVVAITTAAAPTVPAAPSAVTASANTSSSVTLSWVAPSSGNPPTGYQVQLKLASAGTFTNFSTTTTALTQVITGLASSSTYNFQVIAFNAVGSGPPSSPVVVSATTAPVVTANFTISSGRILTPAGAIFKGMGINLNTDQLSAASTSAAGTPLLTRFPGLKAIRMSCHSYVTPASISTFITQMTNLQIPVVIEDHTGPIGGPPYTGSQGATQLAWYASMATAFKTNAYVWFGTQNEAYPVTSGNGDDVTTHHINVYNTVRNAGNGTLVLMDPMGGGNPNELPGGSGPQLTASRYAPLLGVVWDYHYYNWASGYSGVRATILSSFNSFIARLQTITSANGVIPIFVGEYGVSTTGNLPDDTGGVFAVDVVGTSGYPSTAWHWNAGGTSDNLTAGSPGVGGGALTTFGQQVAALIVANG